MIFFTRPPSGFIDEVKQTIEPYGRPPQRAASGFQEERRFGEQLDPTRRPAAEWG